MCVISLFRRRACELLFWKNGHSIVIKINPIFLFLLWGILILNVDLREFHALMSCLIEHHVNGWNFSYIENQWTETVICPTQNRVYQRHSFIPCEMCRKLLTVKHIFVWSRKFTAHGIALRHFWSSFSRIILWEKTLRNAPKQFHVTATHSNFYSNCTRSSMLADNCLVTKVMSYLQEVNIFSKI